MNQLRRMVLVNSANVRYREVELDGHIHFIGTQGTGKSTLLRAILYFYNADSRKLGISKDKKTFAEYYFPHADSYIFYEVQASTRRFCVWLYKRQNRLCFRFIDSGYDQEIVLDNNRARGEAELMAKAAELDIKVERAIHNFTEYRDILYGENRSMRRYALVQGVSNYLTIPRTISNVFLNANLDGGYIKKTIIDSLSDEAVEINLETNRHHLETARNHYADVSEYLRQEVKAEKIVTAYVAVLELEERQRDTARKIGVAFNQAREQKLELQEQISSKDEEELNQQSILKDVREKGETEKRRLGDQLAVAKKNIIQSNERKRHYVQLGIDEVLKAAAEQSRIELELQHCREKLRVLTTKAEQQEAQFDIARQKLNNESQERMQQAQAELHDVKDRNREEQDLARRRQEEQQAILLVEFEEQIEPLQADHSQEKDEISKLEQEQYRLDYTPLFEDERKRLDVQGQELEQRNIRLEEEQKRNKDATDALLREADDRKIIEKSEREKLLRPLTDERDDLKQKYATLKQELESLSGSLLEFLDDEVSGWQETIGKTVRRNVLLQSGLEPKKSAGCSLYGVELKLEHVEHKELSKTALEESLADTEKALEKLCGRIEKQLNDSRTAEDRLLQKYNRKIKALQASGKSISIDLFSVQRDLERNTLARRDLTNKITEKRLALQREVEKKIHESRSALQELGAVIANLKESYETSRVRLASDVDRRLKLLKKELVKKEKQCDQMLLEQEQRLDERLVQLEKDRASVLEKAGVDPQKVARLDEKIQRFEKKLDAIRNTETIRIEYAKDKRELIDKLPEFKSQRAQLEEKQEHQVGLFNRRIRQERTRLNAIVEVLKVLKEQLRQAEDEVVAFKAFEKEELFSVFESFIRHHDSGGEFSCRERIGELKNLAWKYEKQFKQLTEMITSFAGLFSDGNCLGFEVHLSNEASFRAFAEVLSAFVKEQKVITLKTEVTKKYSMVLNTIVTETNRLLQREGEVQRVILKINSDFRSSNFVGVVHSIEMRIRESSNSVFQVLRDICQFQVDNHMSFGEIDLFNRGDSGNDEKAIELLEQLRMQMTLTKNTKLKLEDALDLEFRVCENENDTNWVNRLANVGSNGTDVLVKSMIYINLLNIFKTRKKKQSEQPILHCLVDEVGILHESNVASLINFAAERGICMINGSPNSHNEQDYKHIYIFRKDDGNNTAITKLLSNVS